MLMKPTIRKFWPTIAGIGLAWALSAGPLNAAEPGPGTTETRGIPVGKPAPAFTLPSAGGERISLESLLRKGKVALVFYRSADW